MRQTDDSPLSRSNMLAQLPNRCIMHFRVSIVINDSNYTRDGISVWINWVKKHNSSAKPLLLRWTANKQTIHRDQTCLNNSRTPVQIRYMLSRFWPQWNCHIINNCKLKYWQHKALNNCTLFQSHPKGGCV